MKSHRNIQRAAVSVALALTIGVAATGCVRTGGTQGRYCSIVSEIAKSNRPATVAEQSELASNSPNGPLRAGHQTLAGATDDQARMAAAREVVDTFDKSHCRVTLPWGS